METQSIGHGITEVHGVGYMGVSDGVERWVQVTLYGIDTGDVGEIYCGRCTI